MLFSCSIPRYTSKDVPILVGSMLPMAVVINHLLFGSTYFEHLGMFLGATLSTFSVLAVSFITYGCVALFLRNRFPEDHQVLKRLTICIAIFVLMSALYISLILTSYDNKHFFGYQYRDSDFIKCFIVFIVTNIFLTFLNEGVYRFERYRSTIRENEQLKKEYMHSQLLGLKSQMNPHFLFNSLNTLSSLIAEEGDEAEDFLDHMSKVYRYLLRNNEEQLVTVDTELAFIRSYSYLLKARYAEGLDIDVDIQDGCRQHRIPPLTLQMIIEHTLNQNVLSRSQPLHIHVHSGDNWLEVRNGVQPKISSYDRQCEVIENIANKFRLLCQQEIVIQESGTERIIRLPLIPHQEMAFP